MGNMPSHKIFNYATVSSFERTKATDIERLELVGRMGRHTKRNNVVVVAVGLEICRMVAFVTIEDKETFFGLARVRRRPGEDARDRGATSEEGSVAREVDVGVDVDE